MIRYTAERSPSGLHFRVLEVGPSRPEPDLAIEALEQRPEPTTSPSARAAWRPGR